MAKRKAPPGAYSPGNRGQASVGIPRRVRRKEVLAFPVCIDDEHEFLCDGQTDPVYTFDDETKAILTQHTLLSEM